MIPKERLEAAAAAWKALQRGRQAAAANRLREARRQFARAIELNPRLVQAWLWRGWLADNDRLAARCFHEALRLQPANRAARAGLRRLSRRRMLGQAPPAQPPRSRQRASARERWLTIALLAVAIVGAAGMVWRASGLPSATAALAPATPTATPRPAERYRAAAAAAWDRQDTTEALRLWEKALAEEPDDTALRGRLVSSYVELATSHLQAYSPDEAEPLLRRAVALAPGDENLAHEHRALLAYLAGRDALAAGDTDAAISHLLPLFEQDPYYLDVPDLLFNAFMRRGQALSDAGEYAAAKAAYENALLYRSQDAQARARLTAVAALAAQPTPTPIPKKRIVVDVSEQHFYAYEGNRLVYSFVTSTGEPGRPTKYGTYHVQSKIRNARSNVWHLWMPYWLGIYWVGNIENGIHGLPVLDNGGKLWAGYLGRRVSFGCVILDDEAAKTIFNWAEIGTEVVIQP
jgi:tetratricopeptide (TPR) repeat protein